jgi:hypothetical protein
LRQYTPCYTLLILPCFVVVVTSLDNVHVGLVRLVEV